MLHSEMAIGCKHLQGRHIPGMNGAIKLVYEWSNKISLVKTFDTMHNLLNIKQTTYVAKAVGTV